MEFTHYSLHWTTRELWRNHIAEVDLFLSGRSILRLATDDDRVARKNLWESESKKIHVST